MKRNSQCIKENVVLVDYEENDSWAFLEALGNRTSSHWVLKKKVTNRMHGTFVKNLCRQLWYFLFPLLIVLRRGRYDKIVGWQQFYGLNFAFWCRLFHLRKVNDLTVMTFIYKKKSGMAGRLYHKYIRYIVTGRYIDRFICFSKEECGYYASVFGVDSSRFIFVPLGVAAVSGVNVGDRGYMFATGRSNRNYDFIVDALADTSIPIKIACDSYMRRDMPANVEVLRDCYGIAAADMMACSRCVLIPLKNPMMSSGHLVALHAMSLGKPVVCTDSDGIRDYVFDGKTGFVVDNTREAWLSAIDRLQDEKLYSTIGETARNLFYEQFTDDVMYRRISEIING